MLRLRARLLLLVATLVLIAGAAAGGARATTPPSLFDPCASVAPDATLTLGPGVPKVETTKQAAFYTTGFCTRFVVDVQVPSNSSGGPGYYDEVRLDGLYAGPSYAYAMGLPLPESLCSMYSGHLRIYRKTLMQPEFTRIGGGQTYGAWFPGGPETLGPGCMPTKSSGYDEVPKLEPMRYGTVYRVAFAAKLGDVYQTVRVRASHPPIIY